MQGGLKKYKVLLQSQPSESFRCTKAAQSLDINVAEKLKHELVIEADLQTDFSIGMIIGNSGSGKTTLAKSIFGENVFKERLDASRPVIEQFPDSMSYEECSDMLNGIGLTSVPCWIRPASTLSNGQKARAEAALALCSEDKLVVIDEWTSVVDRTVAKVMSHCLSKFSKKFSDKKIILISCHFDIIDWINPDWIIDCNKQEYTDRRLLRPDFKRSEKLAFDIRSTTWHPWRMFAKYHYLSHNILAASKCFGLFHGSQQIGFGAYTSYLPGRQNILYSNRVVIHPDYCGFGLGLKFVNMTASHLKGQGFDIRAKFSSIPLLKARQKDKKNWRQRNSDVNFVTGQEHRSKKKVRNKVRTFVFDYIGD